eukprot:tig00000204_g17749.t2
MWSLDGITSQKVQVDPISPQYRVNCWWFITVELRTKDPAAGASAPVSFALRAQTQPFPAKTIQQMTSSLAEVIPFFVASISISLKGDTHTYRYSRGKSEKRGGQRIRRVRTRRRKRTISD